MPYPTLVDFFIHESRFKEPNQLRRARIFVRTCILTCLFSILYLVLSVYFDFPEGMYLMALHVVTCLVLPILVRTRIPLAWLGNIFLLLGGSSVIGLTYLSGGLWSAIYPWIIVIPVTALLIVNRLSAIVWGVISFACMVWFGVYALQTNQVPEYSNESAVWFTAIIPGLLLIILLISFVFEFIMSNALKEVESKNELLASQNETINDQAARLEELIEEKDYIIQILAHDLRSPLNNISALVEMMRIEQKPEEQQFNLEMITRATSNAHNLVSRVLEMDASAQEDVKTELRNLHITELLEAVMSDSQKIAEKKNIQLHVRDNITNKMVRADQTCLTQVFQNLVSNAIKFSPEGTHVQAVLSSDNNSVQVRIIDEGPGIKEGEESKLFKKFSKLSTRPTAGESSAGLGLSLVKRYAELTGAKVWYERNQGTGATFVVEIPFSEILR